MHPTRRQMSSSRLHRTVGIFCDLEECPSTTEALELLRSFSGKLGGVATFNIYCNIGRMSCAVRKFLPETDARIREPRKEDPTAVNIMLLADVLGFALDFPPPSAATVVLVSASEQLTTLVSQLQKKDYIVHVVAHAEHCPLTLRSLADSFYDWKELAQAIVDLSELRTSEEVQNGKELALGFGEESEGVNFERLGMERLGMDSVEDAKEVEKIALGELKMEDSFFDDLAMAQAESGPPTPSQSMSQSMSQSASQSVSQSASPPASPSPTNEKSPFSVRGKCKRFVWHVLAGGFRPESKEELRSELERFFSPATEESIDEVVNLLKRLGVSTDETIWCASTAAQFARSVSSTSTTVPTTINGNGPHTGNGPILQSPGTRTYVAKPHTSQRNWKENRQAETNSPRTGGAASGTSPSTGTSTVAVERKVFTPAMTKARCLEFVRHGVEQHITPRSKIDLNAELMKYFRPQPGETIVDVLKMLYTTGIASYANVWDRDAATHYLEKSSGTGSNEAHTTVPLNGQDSYGAGPKASGTINNDATAKRPHEIVNATKMRCKRFVEHALEQKLVVFNKAELNEALLKFFRPQPGGRDVTEVRGMLIAYGVSTPDDVWRADVALKLVSKPKAPVDMNDVGGSGSMHFYLDTASRIRASVLNAIAVRLRFVRSTCEVNGKPWPQSRDSWTKLMDGYTWQKPDGSSTWKRPNLHLLDLAKVGCVIRNPDQSLSWQHDMIEVLIGPSRGSAPKGGEWETTVNKLLRNAFEQRLQPKKAADLPRCMQKFVGPLSPQQLQTMNDLLHASGVTGFRVWDADAAAQLLLTRAVLRIDTRALKNSSRSGNYSSGGFQTQSRRSYVYGGTRNHSNTNDSRGKYGANASGTRYG